MQKVANVPLFCPKMKQQDVVLTPVVLVAGRVPWWIKTRACKALWIVVAGIVCLIDFRDWLKSIRNDPAMRQVARRNGQVTLSTLLIKINHVYRLV
jgi:hypothetical protein